MVLPPDHAELVSAFRTWAGTDADLRVFFTPDVLVGFDSPNRRGYLFDDGWTVEVWIERGLEEFLGLLQAGYVAARCQVERPANDPSPQRGLLELALRHGSPIGEVRHLL